MLTKKDAKMAQGLAIIGMVALHLFCRIDNLPYNVHIFLGGRPLIYYIGLFGDFCVPIYCFCSGYAQQIMYEKEHKIGKLKQQLEEIKCAENEGEIKNGE